VALAACARSEEVRCAASLELPRRLLRRSKIRPHSPPQASWLWSEKGPSKNRIQAATDAPCAQHDCAAVAIEDAPFTWASKMGRFFSFLHVENLFCGIRTFVAKHLQQSLNVRHRDGTNDHYRPDLASLKTLSMKSDRPNESPESVRENAVTILRCILITKRCCSG
jgi:hypothetical protein